MTPSLRATLSVICLTFFALFPAAFVVAEEEMTLNLIGADIEATVKAMGQATGRNFVLDPRVKGTINISSGKPVSKELAYQVLVSALRLQGYAVVENGSLTKIMPEADARVHGGPVSRKGVLQGDQIVTRVFHIRYESAPQMVGVLRPLVGNNQSVTANTGSNTLVVTDSAENIQRLERIIAAIDIPHGDDPRIILLKHASAVEVANSLTRLFANRAGQGAGNQLVASAEPRSNRLILQSDNAGILARATTLAAEMDKPESGLGNIRVVYLKHAEASKMAQMLRAILGGESGGAGGVTAPASGASPGASGGLGSPNTSATGVLSQGAGASQHSAALLSGSMIQADVGSNALIITAPESVFNNLQNVIAMLDRRRAQVQIEALIVELTAERAAEFGIQWQDLSGLSKKSTQAIGGSNFGNSGTNIISAATNIASVGKGLSFGIVDGTINIPGLGTITNLGFLARFLESEAHANILSTPSIMTLDNEEAKIVIGQNLPFVTGSYSATGASTAVVPFQTYERKDVGLTLRVRPQITEGGVVRVQIYQEASSVRSGTANNTNGPITNKRSIESSILVDNGSIIALGGLIEDSFGADEEKVPVLGDIPFLRNLFRYENRNRKKTNLMVFLRPRIVREEREARDIAEDRYDMLLNAQKNQALSIAQPAWGDASVPELPAFSRSTAEGARAANRHAN